MTTVYHFRLICYSYLLTTPKGRRSLFGRDKFQPAMERFNAILEQCVESLKDDGKLEWASTAEEEMAAIDTALSAYRSAYSKKYLAIEFWEQWYANFLEQLPEIPSNPSDELKEWLENRDEALQFKRSFAEEGGHIMLSSEVYDADALSEPLRSEAIIHMRRRKNQDT